MRQTPGGTRWSGGGGGQMLKDRFPNLRHGWRESVKDLYDTPLLVDEYKRRDAVDIVLRGHLRVASQKHGIRHLKLFHKTDHRTGIIIDSQTQHHESLVFIFGIKFLHTGDRHSTRTTPRGPEVEQDRMFFEGG